MSDLLIIQRILFLYFFNSDDERPAARSGCAVKVDADPVNTENPMLIRSHWNQIPLAQWDLAVDHEFFQRLSSAGGTHDVMRPARAEQDLFG